MLKFLPRVLAAFAFLLAPAAHAQEVQDADPALWVVRDADTTIYLFGTFHLLKPGLGWFDEAVKAAFDESNEVVLEMVEPTPAVAQGLIFKAAASNDGRPLTERLPEAERAAYLAALEKAQIPPAMLDGLDPWFASVNLTISALLANGFDPSSGAEPIITAAAKAAGKPVSGLETMEQQLGFFDGLSDTAQVAMLMSTIRELPELDTTIGAMVSDWAKGDADAIAALLNANLSDSPETAQVLLTARNERWAEWIATRMEQPGTVFVAVGAGHLAGSQSVQTFLAGRGLTAERVQY